MRAGEPWVSCNMITLYLSSKEVTYLTFNNNRSGLEEQNKEAVFHITQLKSLQDKKLGTVLGTQVGRLGGGDFFEGKNNPPKVLGKEGRAGGRGEEREERGSMGSGEGKKKREESEGKGGREQGAACGGDT